MKVSRAALVAGLAGFATMCLELTAVRVLAPHFGDSAYVWTNVIGVILVALAAGAFWGGRLADRHGARRLSLLFGLGAALVALAPLLARPLGSWLLPEELPLDSAMPALVRGSLLATMVLFAPAVLLLGTSGPMLVTLVARGGGAVGRAVGAVAASSTLGSLLGTFAATHLLVPGIGSRLTLWLCALLLAVCSLLMWRAAAPALTAALVGCSALLPLGPLGATAPGWELLEERESPYQYLQVVRSGPLPEGRVTALKINEGLDSFHSVAVEGSPWSGGRYYDYHAVAPYLAGAGVVPQPLRVLSLGDAAGTFNRIYHAAFPECTMDAVEIDPVTVELGDKWFGGRPAPGRVWAGMDARVFVECSRGEYDVVLVDAYEHQVYIPAHLASRQFFESLQHRLAAGGVVSINVGGLHFDDPVLVAMARTMAAVFGEAWAFRVPRSRNFVVVARQGAALDPKALARARAEEPRLAEVLAAAGNASSWRRYEAGGPVLDDDRPVLDRLLDRSYLAGEGSEQTLPMGGTVRPEDAGEAAHRALSAGDPEEALRQLQSASGETAYLRLLAGDARWLLRQLHGARAEYRRALSLQPEAAFATLIESRLANLAEDLRLAEEARAVARRNGWLALAAGVVLLGSLAVAFRV